MSYQAPPHAFRSGVEVKQCYRCAYWLPLARFGRDRGRWDGLVPWCKDCRGKPIRAGFVERREAIDQTAPRRCTHCKVVKPAESFGRHPDSPGGRQAWCNQCRTAHKAAKRIRIRAAGGRPK